jgi:hypothetical protein
MANEKLWSVGSRERPVIVVCTRKDEDGDSAVSAEVMEERGLPLATVMSVATGGRGGRPTT